MQKKSKKPHLTGMLHDILHYVAQGGDAGIRRKKLESAMRHMLPGGLRVLRRALNDGLLVMREDTYTLKPKGWETLREDGGE